MFMWKMFKHNFKTALSKFLSFLAKAAPEHRHTLQLCRRTEIFPKILIRRQRPERSERVLPFFADRSRSMRLMTSVRFCNYNSFASKLSSLYERARGVFDRTTFFLVNLRPSFLFSFMLTAAFHYSAAGLHGGLWPLTSLIAIGPSFSARQCS